MGSQYYFFKVLSVNRVNIELYKNDDTYEIIMRCGLKNLSLLNLIMYHQIYLIR